MSLRQRKDPEELCNSRHQCRAARITPRGRRDYPSNDWLFCEYVAHVLPYFLKDMSSLCQWPKKHILTTERGHLLQSSGDYDQNRSVWPKWHVMWITDNCRRLAQYYLKYLGLCGTDPCCLLLRSSLKVQGNYCSSVLRRALKLHTVMTKCWCCKILLSFSQQQCTQGTWTDLCTCGVYLVISTGITV